MSSRMPQDEHKTKLMSDTGSVPQKGSRACLMVFFLSLFFVKGNVLPVFILLVPLKAEGKNTYQRMKCKLSRPVPQHVIIMFSTGKY